MLADKTYHAVSMQVVRLLKAEREKRGLSKYAVAKRCGLSEQMIGYVERGMRSPSFETVLRLAAGVGVDLGRVMKRAAKEAASRPAR